MSRADLCPETVGTWHNYNTAGICIWCGDDIGLPPRPTIIWKGYDDEEPVINPITLEPEEWPYEGR